MNETTIAQLKSLRRQINAEEDNVRIARTKRRSLLRQVDEIKEESPAEVLAVFPAPKRGVKKMAT
jgi:hypothetical protein